MKSSIVIVLGFGALVLTGCVSSAPQGGSNPEDAAQYNVKLGVAYMQQGRLDVALQKLKRALKENPDSAPAHAALARLYARRGSMSRARQYYRKAIDLAPDDPKIQNAYGVFLCRHGKAVQSERYFIAAAGNPDYITPEAAYTNAGICQLNVGKRDAAEADFRRALKSKPGYTSALWQLARLSFKQGEHMDARAFLQRLLADNKHPQAKVLWLAARNERALGADDSANKLAHRLIVQWPRSSEAALARKTHRHGG
jgi:type IV pilus assembly protein PilF